MCGKHVSLGNTYPCIPVTHIPIDVITFDIVITLGTFTHDSAVKEDVMDKEENGVMNDDEGRNDEDIAK